MLSASLKKVRDFVLAAEHGDFSCALPEADDAELQELHESLRRLVDELRSYRERQVGQRASEEAIEKELRISRAIQSSLLPSMLPEIDGLDVAAFYQPAREIGGDYYDFIEIDSNHLGIAVADVSGKSISGAMLMSVTRNTLRSQAMLTLSPSEVLERTDRLLAPSMLPGFFVSVFYAILDVESKKMLCANAGHPPMLLCRDEEKKVEWVHPKGMALGLSRLKSGLSLKLMEQECSLKEGDVAFLYTDGVTETANPSGTLYGRERLASFVHKMDAVGAGGFLSLLEKELDGFRAGLPRQDDTTGVVLMRHSERVSIGSDSFRPVERSER